MLQGRLDCVRHTSLQWSSSVLLDLLLLNTNGSVVLGQVVSELLVRTLLEHSLLPEVGSQVGVGGSHSSIGGLGKVAQGASGATS